MKFLAILFFFLLLFSCQNKEKTKEEKLTISNIKDHFYPYDTVPKIYVYRDVVGGLEEKFHRVYALQDQEGKHVIVEIYSSDFRIIEALNYDYSTLLYKDHMVVNRNKEKTKADLIKNKAFPSDDKSIAEFSSRFPGHLDSSLIIKEIKRKWNKNQVKTVNVLQKNLSVFSFYDQVTQTLLNPYTKKQAVISSDQISNYGKGIGLIEWYSPNKKAHFRLEKILDQKQWIEITNKIKR